MMKPQKHILLWMAALTLGAGLLAVTIGNDSFGIIAIFSVLFVATALITRGFFAHSPNTSSAEFFGACSDMASRTTLQSLGSSWIMLANVVVADMFIGQLFGVITAWMVFTWAFAFILMSYRVDQIRSVLSSDDTLHTFLHRAYGSVAMRKVAAGITVFVGVGVFCTELIAGMALLVAVLPAPQAAVVSPILILLLVIAMCVAGIAGGLRAVITTDSMLWPIVFLGVISLLFFSVVPFSEVVPGRPPIALVPAGLTRGGGIAFIVGVTALQVPLMLGDYGTWQRIKATKVGEEKSLAYHTLWQALWQAILWGFPAVAGVALIGLPALYEAQSGNLYGSSSPLIEIIRHWVSAPSVPLPLRAAVLAVFLVGMLAIMVSTANTYLLVAMETWVRDLKPQARIQGEPPEATDIAAVQRARLLCVLIALVACLPIALLLALNINLLSVVVIVFSLQVALAPAAVVGLYQAELAKRIAKPVVTGTICGFTAALIFGLYMMYLAPVWGQLYGVFLTATIALGVPTAVISLSLLWTGGGKASMRVLFGKLLWPWA
jgi:Na+/pantothenate symporter